MQLMFWLTPCRSKELANISYCSNESSKKNFQPLSFPRYHHNAASFPSTITTFLKMALHWKVFLDAVVKSSIHWSDQSITADPPPKQHCSNAWLGNVVPTPFTLYVHCTPNDGVGAKAEANARDERMTVATTFMVTRRYEREFFF